MNEEAEAGPPQDGLPNWAKAYPRRGKKVVNTEDPPGDDAPVTRELRQAAKRLHEDLGHPPAHKLVAALRNHGASAQLLKAASEHVCVGCLSRQRPAIPLSAKLPLAENFNDLVHLDLFDLHDIKGQKLIIMNLVDHATQYQQVVPLPGKHPRLVIEAVIRHWVTAFGKPASIHADQGGEFFAEFLNEAQSMGIPVYHSPRFTPQQNAQAERRGGVYKYIAQAAAVNAKVEFRWADKRKERASLDTWSFLQNCAHAANNMIRGHGYNPAQLAFGRSIRIPFQLLTPYAQYAMASRVEQEENFSRKFHYMRAAQQAAATFQHDLRLSQALASRPRGDRTQQPTEVSCKPGDQVFFYISPAPRFRTKRWWVHRWVGPAVVLGFEKNAAWISWKRRLLKVARHHIRPATIEERMHWEEMASQMYDPGATDPLEKTREATHRPDGGVDDYHEGLASDDNDDDDDGAGDYGHRIMTQNAGRADLTPLTERPSTVPMMDVEGAQQGQKRQRDDTESGVDQERQGPPQVRRRYRIKQKPSYLDRTADTFADDINVPSAGDGYQHIDDPADPRLHDPGYHAPSMAREGQEQESGYDQGGLEPMPEPKRRRQEHDWSEYLVDTEKQLLVHSRSRPELVALVGAARVQKEVQWHALSAAERIEFQEAIKKEWDVWEQYAATRPLTAQERAQVSNKELTPIPTRWVFTWKAAGPVGSTNRKAKARLVAQGFREKDQGWERWSPTASAFALHMILVIGSAPNWRVFGFDCRNAYLQSTLQRETVQVLRMPRQEPLVPGTDAGELRVAMRAIYGSIDAGRQWYLHFKNVLREFGVHEMTSEPGMYVLRGDDQLPIIAIHSHVDDALVAIDGTQRSLDLLHQLASALNAKDSLEEITSEPRRHLGRVIFRDGDGRFVVQQTLSFENLVETKPDEDLQRVLSSSELSQLRSIVGQLLWYARCTLPEVYERTIICARAMKDPRLHDLREAVALASRYKDHVAEVRFPAVGDITRMDFVAFVDASFANAPDDNSVVGHYIGLTPRDNVEMVVKGDYTLFAPLAWGTGTTRRVTRSTLGAETYACSEGAELSEWMRFVWLELLQGSMPTDAVPSTVRDVTTGIHLLTDSASLSAAAQSKRQDTASHDKRARIAIKHMQQLIDDPGESMSLRWIPTVAQVADPFTKDMNPVLLREALKLNDARSIIEKMKAKVDESKAKHRNRKKNAQLEGEHQNEVNFVNWCALVSCSASICGCVCCMKRGRDESMDAIHTDSVMAQASRSQTQSTSSQTSDIPANVCSRVVMAQNVFRMLNRHRRFGTTIPWEQGMICCQCQMGQSGRFVPCADYMVCRHFLCVSCASRDELCKHHSRQSENFVTADIDYVSRLVHCERCHQPMKKKQPRHGRGWFLGCSAFPACTWVVSPKDVQVTMTRQRDSSVTVVPDRFLVVDRD
eukprot:3756037-Amphidinium_carterae.1